MPPASGSRLAAALVHVYTAIGAVLAFLMVVAIEARAITVALWLFLVAMLVDGTDGLLARRFRVKEHWPGFDGALLDNIVDYLTYCFAPVTLLWIGGYLPTGPLGWVVACAPLLASCFQFCRADAKTDDHLFWGFPSYWNVVAFYVVVLGLGPVATSALVLLCSALVFVPIGYVYPSRTQTWWVANMVGAGLWLLAYAVIVASQPTPPAWVVAASLAYIAFYIGESLWLTARRRRASSGAALAETAQLPV
ncbi:MAG TPA: CDP-alcohol phosphatidyltransferase family protein [Dermatophilaceae bacterium]|nr:CDP-alcohol phosphatidyltransferase family protein [Dermatophilaceae bacterium]HMT88602.1 CDP-alcohol phosphatidyltransferase family protein [Dermatophilaceae bacterium]